MDLSSEIEAFPYPTRFQWWKNGVEISNTSTTALGYPRAEFETVSRDDAGLYSLTASNYNLDDPSQEIGERTGCFELVVFCKSHLQ